MKLERRHSCRPGGFAVARRANWDEREDEDEGRRRRVHGLNARPTLDVGAFHEPVWSPAFRRSGAENQRARRI
jgi:hypothetical protein